MKRFQTSCRIPAQAVAAIADLGADWGTTRDETTRRLIQFFIDTQTAVANEEERLLHISTVLRAARWHELRDNWARIPLRLDPGMDEAVTALAVRLPGRSQRQGHRDYAARPLGDALVVAAALHHAFEVKGVEGLPQILRNCEAAGLWRLTTAATRTLPELELLRGKESDLQSDLREGLVGWNSPWRADVALHMAHKLLGPSRNVTHNLLMLGKQGDLFEHHERELENSEVFGDRTLTEDAPRPSSDHSGRGSAAIWRGRRRAALEGLAQWLTSASPEPQHVLKPPGWTLIPIPGWHAHAFERTAELGDELQALVDAGQVLRIDHRTKSALWPLTGDRAPVDGFASLLAGAGRTPPLRIVEAFLTRRIAFGDSEGYWLRLPWTSAENAYQLGFITAEEKALRVANAKAKTERDIAAFIAAEERHGESAEVIADLRAAAADPDGFAELVNHLHTRFRVTSATWSWEIASVDEGVQRATSPHQLEWLGQAWIRQVRVALESDMQSAWYAGFFAARGRFLYDDDDADEFEQEYLRMVLGLDG